MNMTNEELNDVLKQIADTEGRLTPKVVVARAADPSHPLHEHFEWDDSKAAQLHRENMARALIRRATFLVTTETVTFRAPMFIRDPEAAADMQGYRQTVQIKKEPDNAHAALAEEMARAAAALRRARIIASALGLEDRIVEIEQLVTGVRDEIVQQEQAKQPAAAMQ